MNQGNLWGDALNPHNSGDDIVSGRRLPHQQGLVGGGYCNPSDLMRGTNRGIHLGHSDLQFYQGANMTDTDAHNLYPGDSSNVGKESHLQSSHQAPRMSNWGYEMSGITHTGPLDERHRQMHPPWRSSTLPVNFKASSQYLDHDPMISSFEDGIIPRANGPGIGEIGIGWIAHALYNQPPSDQFQQASYDNMPNEMSGNPPIDYSQTPADGSGILIASHASIHSQAWTQANHLETLITEREVNQSPVNLSPPSDSPESQLKVYRQRVTQSARNILAPLTTSPTSGQGSSIPSPKAMSPIETYRQQVIASAGHILKQSPPSSTSPTSESYSVAGPDRIDRPLNDDTEQFSQGVEQCYAPRKSASGVCRGI